ncbi:hypothetical protein AV530_016256 [Patagioenas fasciata monilis]|uniref:Uncharacterized protein n=1 Tax=Patagioenas fasciata monilis TaxID=372326 RepID=A0A1V4JWT7_PATFA|nr:hypothetical protein AV530_016256 [Patagioenas fasciata monilis]
MDTILPGPPRQAAGAWGVRQGPQLSQGLARISQFSKTCEDGRYNARDRKWIILQNRRADHVKQFIFHNTLDPQEADCAPTMNHFQLILELRRDRSLLPTDRTMNAMENPACFGQNFILEAEGPCYRRNTMRISGLWPCPILPLLFSEGEVQGAEVELQQLG